MRFCRVEENRKEQKKKNPKRRKRENEKELSFVCTSHDCFEHGRVARAVSKREQESLCLQR
jgi:hypothetical protein